MLLRLSEIGITHISDLDGKSTEEIWLQLYLNDTNVSYHEIYAIEGAKARVKTSEILQTRKATLAAFVNDSIK